MAGTTGSVTTGKTWKIEAGMRKMPKKVTFVVQKHGLARLETRIVWKPLMWQLLLKR